MKNTRFWIIAALVSVTAALGCGSEDEAAPSSAAGEGDGQRAQATAPASQPQEDHQSQEASGEERAPVSFDAPPPVGARAHCPVMDHDFVIAEDTLRSEHNGRHYVFCCPACKPRFDEAPERFLSGASHSG